MASQNSEHFDVVIVGAGISGVGGAYHLTKQCPGTSFIVLEAQESFGGTWLTHRYPGIRSDSDLDLFLGYRFKPVHSAPLYELAEILSYMGEVIDENDLGRHIRYRHEIKSARWSSSEIFWTLEATRMNTGESLRFTANFLWMCQGYYRVSGGAIRRNGLGWRITRARSFTRRIGRRISTTHARMSSSSARCLLSLALSVGRSAGFGSPGSSIEKGGGRTRWPLVDSCAVVICNVIGEVNCGQPGYYVDNSGPAENDSASSLRQPRVDVRSQRTDLTPRWQS